METYKLGNKVNGIIRAFAPCKIGDCVLQYDNQPYTTIKSATANLRFKDLQRDGRIQEGRALAFSQSFVDSVQLSEIEVTEKILNLIFSKSEPNLAHKVENLDSDDNNLIYLSLDETVYQVFVYNDEGKLDQAFGTLSNGQPIRVSKPNSNYVVIYSYVTDYVLNLNSPQNLYWTLDLEVIGNIDDKTSSM